MTLQDDIIMTRRLPQDDGWPCHFCGDPVAWIPGYGLALERREQPLCDDCAAYRAPHLHDALYLANRYSQTVFLGSDGPLPVEQVLRDQAPSDEALAAQHADLVHMPLSDEQEQEFRALERRLILRGRIDVLQRNGVWTVTRDDREYQTNELIRGAYFHDRGVIELERLDLDPDTYVTTAGPAVCYVYKVGNIDLAPPVPCEVCREPVSATPPFFVTNDLDRLVCRGCTERYAMSAGGVTTLQTPTDEKRT